MPHTLLLRSRLIIEVTSLLVIIFRYLVKEIIMTMMAVSGAALIIIMSGRFVKYLAEAASGKISSDILFSIMLFRLPGFLELILPLGFFIAVLLSYGRLCMDSEMTVLSACGMSQRQLVGYTLIPSFFIAGIVGAISLYVGPLGMQKVEVLFNNQESLSVLDTLTPGRFQTQSGERVIYTEKLSEDRAEMKNVFISAISEPHQSNIIDSQENTVDSQVNIIVAESGKQEINERDGTRYIVFSNGYSYQGLPGRTDYQIVKFERYGQLLENPKKDELQSIKREALSTKVLWASDLPEDIATLQWRLSLPLIVPILALLAVPLSHTNPRQGRYAKLIPALILYLVYLIFLNIARGALEDSKIPMWLGIWWVHGIFLSIAIFLLSKRRLS